MAETSIKGVGRDQSLPTPGNQGEQLTVRSSKYGELLTQPLNRRALALEGSYFIATNPTIGTGIAGIAASTSYDAAEHLLWVRNTSTTKKLVLDFIEITCTAAGASGTTTGFTLTTDKGTSRRGTGGSDITAIHCPNRSLSESPECSVAFGALATAAASADVKLVFNGLARSVIKVVGDSYRFNFVDDDKWSFCGTDLAGTAIAKVNIPNQPVILGENDQFLLSDWGASQSGASSYEFRMGFWMR